ncbi:hypothetical protein HanRHA438_Chr06g0254251 [Helianthus annuus]|nr:hypothetical protein HanRHA438_Chr06g0254251 [Helianthus annuus]
MCVSGGKDCADVHAAKMITGARISTPIAPPVMMLGGAMGRHSLPTRDIPPITQGLKRKDVSYILQPSWKRNYIVIQKEVFSLLSKR